MYVLKYTVKSSIKPPRRFIFSSTFRGGGGGGLNREGGLKERVAYLILAISITGSKNIVVSDRVDLQVV